MAFSFLNRAVPTAALLAIAAFVVPTPAQAQDLLFTLSGVVFQDNATAVGSFIYNPTTNLFSAFDITTSTGNTGLTGENYTSTIPTSLAIAFTPTFFSFNNGISGGNSLGLSLFTAPTGPGVYALRPGAVFGTGVSNSGEVVNTIPRTPRAITAGNLIVTNAAASAPEPCTIALLLAAGMPVAGLVRRRRKN